ncbi:MAG TPA: ATP-binding protein [Gammaproteobacteria bacterium]|nr:ATP-binding protein [Gammaproteobacteria bacterium]
MIRSIRHFLLISLLISMTIASSITAIGNYVLDKRVIQPYLDDQLIKLFSFIEVISHNAAKHPDTQQKIITYLNNSVNNNTKKFLFQVWTKEKKLLLYSTTGPQKTLLNAPLGFSDIQIKDDDWRVYSTIDPLTKNKIIVAELYDIRNQLADDITRNNGYILLITYPIFGILIWVIVGLALRSITRVTSEISNRASTYLEPVEAENIPVEIKPLVEELNQLFLRLRLAFDRNKRFAGDAAHELRTPLAALKTQAQVALKANNEKSRISALQKVVQSVDRSSHVVAQLLILSRLSQEEELNDIRPLDLHKLVTEITAYLVPIALEKNIEIELVSPPAEIFVEGNDVALGILIRNIVDNAIRYTPEGGQVKIQLLNDDHHRVIFRVIDSGLGIPAELRDRVFERFYRILGTQAQGSGLGLAIVSQIAELHHAKIKLSTPENGKGLQFDVEFTCTNENI